MVISLKNHKNQFDSFITEIYLKEIKNVINEELDTNPNSDYEFKSGKIMDKYIIYKYDEKTGLFLDTKFIN